MAKLLPPEDYLNPATGTSLIEPSTVLSINSGQIAYSNMTATGTPTTTVKRFYNATKKIWLADDSTIKEDAIFCPPGSKIFYEFGDPNAQICLAKQNGDISPPQTGGGDTTDTPPITSGSTDSDIFLAIPFQDPPNSKRATSIKEMYSLTGTSGYSWIYEVGRAPVGLSKQHSLRNNSMSHILRINVTKPNYVSIDTEASFDIPPLHTAIFTSIINEPIVMNLSKTPTRQYNELVLLNVVPLNVTGPVYIKLNLPILTG